MVFVHVKQPLPEGGPPVGEGRDMQGLTEENFIVDVGVGLEDEGELFLSKQSIPKVIRGVPGC